MGRVAKGYHFGESISLKPTACRFENRRTRSKLRQVGPSVNESTAESLVPPTKVGTRARALAATNVSPRDSAELVVMLQLPVEYDLIEAILTDDAACSLDGLVEAAKAAVGGARLVGRGVGP